MSGSVMPCPLVQFALLLLPALVQADDTGRAINSTGLWSKYNLIVKPELAVKPPLVGTTTAVKPLLGTTTAVPLAARWEEEDNYGSESNDERDEQENSDEQQDDDEDDDDDDDDDEDDDEEGYVQHTTQRSKGDSGKRKKQTKKTVKRGKKGHKVHKGHIGLKGLKKLKKYMFPLLIAYKLKFFTLIPLLLGGLVLIVATTGFAGFFFALFAVGVGLKKD